MIRPVTAADVSAITEIYNHYILETVATFEEETLSDEEMAIRIYNISIRYPYLVIEEDGIVVGYAYANQWKPRSAYRFTVETSIYLHKDFVGKGLGKKLYTELVFQVKDAGFQHLISGITLPNETSVKLHEALGFEHVGTFREVGYKFERRVDVGYWEKRY